MRPRVGSRPVVLPAGSLVLTGGRVGIQGGRCRLESVAGRGVAGFWKAVPARCAVVLVLVPSSCTRALAAAVRARGGHVLDATIDQEQAVRLHADEQTWGPPGHTAGPFQVPPGLAAAVLALPEEDARRLGAFDLDGPPTTS